MAEQSFKIAIIGAGTIGLYLAAKLSQQGHKVTVFEKKSDVTGKVCSGLISNRIDDFVDLPENCIIKEMNKCQINFSGKTVNLHFKPIHYLINRDLLNQKLQKLAQDNGVKIYFKHDITQDDFSYFDKIIGCDGALSKTRKILKLPDPPMKLGVQFFLNQKDESQSVQTWPAKQGFFWKIPGNNRIEYGAMGDPHTIVSDLKEFCKKQGIEIGQANIEAAFIPSGIVMPVSQRFALCGDAAGLTKPWSGGGVVWGLKAAQMLVNDFPDFNKYRANAQSFYKPMIQKGNMMLNLVLLLGKKAPFLLPKNVVRDNDFPIV